MRKNKIGKVRIHQGAITKQHELSLAEILVHTGFDVDFIAVGSTKTPDIFFWNRYWEIKSPIGCSSRTIENNLRAALTQSENVILDLRRTSIPDEKTITYLQNHVKNFRKLKTLLIVTKQLEIYRFSQKSTCAIKVRMIK